MEWLEDDNNSDNDEADDRGTDGLANSSVSHSQPVQIVDLQGTE